MKILIATSDFGKFGGQILYNYTVLKYLKELTGFDVWLYCPSMSDFWRRSLRDFGVEICNDLPEIKALSFDVIQASHITTLYEVRYFFPEVPTIYVSHGPNPFLDQPPLRPVGVQGYIAVAEWARDNLIRRGVPAEKIRVIRNPVDSRRFRCPDGPAARFEMVLMVPSCWVSMRNIAKVESACRRMNLRFKLISFSTREFNVEREYVRHDLIVGCGRVCVESLFCRKAVFVYDSLGGDGLLTSSNFDRLKEVNFSGGLAAVDYPVEGSLDEFGKYDAEDTSRCHAHAVRELEASGIVRKIVDYYREIVRGSGGDAVDGEARREIEFMYKLIVESRRAGVFRLLWQTRGGRVLNRLYGFLAKVREQGRTS